LFCKLHASVESKIYVFVFSRNICDFFCFSRKELTKINEITNFRKNRCENFCENKNWCKNFRKNDYFWWKIIFIELLHIFLGGKLRHKWNFKQKRKLIRTFSSKRLFLANEKLDKASAKKIWWKFRTKQKFSRNKILRIFKKLVHFRFLQEWKIGFRLNPTSHTAFSIHIYKNFNHGNLTCNFCLLN
jgi:hypothetical protein